MKSIFAPMITISMALALTFVSTAKANNAAAMFGQLAPNVGMPSNVPVMAFSAADPVDLPTQITETESLGQYVSEL
jgi:hypothetical protein